MQTTVIVLAALLIVAAVGLTATLMHLRRLRGELASQAQQSADWHEKLTAELDAAKKELELLRLKNLEAGRREVELATRLEELQLRKEDWEKARADSMNAAKAAVMETAHQVSSKLLNDSKRENEDVKKQTEERIRKTTEELLTQVRGLSSGLAGLGAQVGENSATLQTVWQALASPGGAGYFAEIGLENTLSSFGLEKGRDFTMQYKIEGDNLRPDAVVFLPGAAVLVIDAKASKFLLELADAEAQEDQEKARADLARTMNQHLKQLAGRNYKSAIYKSHHEAGRAGDVKRILSVMYLPNEGAVEKVGQADPDFMKKATNAEISVVGPTALASLIGFARIEIDIERQAENQERIIETVRLFMDSMSKVIEDTGKLGRGLKTAAKSFEDLTKTLNARLLPRLRRLDQLGVRPTHNRQIPGPMPSYHLVESDSGVIDGEAAEVVAKGSPRLTREKG